MPRPGTGSGPRWNRAERPAMTPSGTPIRSESPTAVSISAKVSMLSSQSPDTAKEANAASAHTPARTPPKRQESAVPATVTPIQVSQTSRSRNQATRLSTKTRNPSKIVNTTPPSPVRRWSIEPGLELVQLERQLVPHEVVRPRVVEPPRAIGQVHERRRFPATCTSLPRHHGRCEITGVTVTASTVVVVIRPRLRSPAAPRRDRPRRRPRRSRPRTPDARSPRSAARRRARSSSRRAAARRAPHRAREGA